MLKEFREFALRGNVLDLAIGVIIGAAFGSIVNSLVNDIIMPPIGLLLGGLDFKDYFLPLRPTELATLDDVRRNGVPVIAYGQFLTTVLSFLIIALCVFLLVKQINKLNKLRKASDEAPSTKECPFCASSIAAKAIRCPYCTAALDAAVKLNP